MSNQMEHVENSPAVNTHVDTQSAWAHEVQSQTTLSQSRDSKDVGVDNSWMAPDKQSADAAQKATNLNDSLLSQLQAGHKVTEMPGLVNEVTKAHQGLSKLDSADAAGDKDAITKDKKDSASETQAIDTLSKATGHPNNNAKSDAVGDNIKSKMHLKANEDGDAVNEQKYLKDDNADVKANNALVDGLKKGSSNLPDLIIEANKAHGNIKADRADDLQKEPGYAKDDKADMASNAAVAKAYGFDLTKGAVK